MRLTQEQRQEQIGNKRRFFPNMESDMSISSQYSLERRKHRRAKINNCMLDANLKFGMLIDISASGMSFYYADRQPWPDRETFRGSLRPEEERSIKNLPVETVADFELPNNFLPGSITVRRRSVRFGALSYMQKKKLTDLINQCEQK